MFCVKCGMRITEDSKFCAHCGAQVPVRKKAPVPSVEAAAAEEGAAEVTVSAVIAEEKTVEVQPEEPAAANEATQEKVEAPAEAEEKRAEEADFSDFSYMAPVTSVEKKSRKGLAIGISAAVVCGAAAVGYFGFSNEISRLIMGDVEFARSVERSTFNYMNGSTVSEEMLNEAIAGAVEGNLTENKTVYNDDLDAILETYGDSEVVMSVDVDLDFLGALTFGKEINNYLDSHSLFRVAQGEDFNKFSYVFVEDEENILGADVYTAEDRTVIALPGLTEQIFFTDNVTDDGERTESFSPEEAARISARLSEIYYKAYDMAEITFTKGEFDLGGDKPVKCQEVRVYFTPELFRATLNEMVDFLENDEYLKNYYINSGAGTEAEYTEFFAAMKEGGGDFTCLNYIKGHRKLCGKKYIIGADTEEGRKTVSGSFALAENGADISFAVEGEYSADISDRKNEDGTSGIITVSITSGETDEEPAVFEIEYSDIDKVDYNGVSVATGKYTLRISEQSVDFSDRQEAAAAEAETAESYTDGFMSDFLTESSLSWGTECDGEKVDSYFSLHIESLGTVTLNTNITPYEGEAPVMPDTSEAIELDGDFDDPQYDGLKKEIYESLISLGEKSDLIKAITEYAKLEDKLKELADKEKYTANFSGYTDEIREYADETAAYVLERYEEEDTLQLLDHISENYEEEYFDAFDTMPLTPEIPSAVEGGAVIKLYFDENGAPSFIDAAGHEFYDFSVISQSDDFRAEYLRNAYVEIFVCGNYGDAIGVNVVYTDNPDKLPENLPTLYNYMDNLYEWGVTDKENIKDNFILGTSCELAEGASAAQRNLERISRYNEIAEGLAKATVNFFELKPDSYFEENFIKNGPESFCIVASYNGDWAETETAYVNGEWTSADSLFTQPFSVQGRSFAKYLNSRSELNYGDAVSCYILFLKNESRYEVAGVIVNAVREPREEFYLNYYDNHDILPEAYELRDGTFGKWNVRSPDKPYVEGLFYSYDDKSHALGTYCVSTGAPLDIVPERADEKGGEGLEDMNAAAEGIAQVAEWLYIDAPIRYERDLLYLSTTAGFNSDEHAAKLYFDENGELNIIESGSLYFLDLEGLAETAKDYRNMYVEIRHISPHMYDFAVTAVSTESPDLIPSSLPDIYSFADGCFEWDNGVDGQKDGYSVGTYPVLETGLGDCREKSAALSAQAETYNGYAEILYRAADEYFKAKSQDFFVKKSNPVIRLERLSGSWNITGYNDDYGKKAADELFTEDITEELTAYLNEKAAINADITAEIIVSNYICTPYCENSAYEYSMDSDMRVIGTSAVPYDIDSFVSESAMPRVISYVDGYSDLWNYDAPYSLFIPGIVYGKKAFPYGTCCAITGTALNDMDALTLYHFPEGE